MERDERTKRNAEMKIVFVVVKEPVLIDAGWVGVVVLMGAAQGVSTGAQP